MSRLNTLNPWIPQNLMTGFNLLPGHGKAMPSRSQGTTICSYVSSRLKMWSRSRQMGELSSFTVYLIGYMRKKSLGESVLHGGLKVGSILPFCVPTTLQCPSILYSTSSHGLAALNHQPARKTTLKYARSSIQRLVHPIQWWTYSFTTSINGKYLL